MKTSPIIAKLDPPRNVLARFLPRRVDGPVDELDLQRAVERFGESVIEAYPGPADRLPYPELFQHPGRVRLFARYDLSLMSG